MARPKKDKTMSTQVSMRLNPQDYVDFQKLAHLNYASMASVARHLILEWIEKNRKRLK